MHFLWILATFLIWPNISFGQNETGSDALAYENEKQLLNEFADYWSLNPQDVIGRHEKMFDLLTNGHSKSVNYTIDTSGQAFEAGLNESDVAKFLADSHVTPEFIDRIKKALGQCPFYIDRQYRFSTSGHHQSIKGQPLVNQNDQGILIFTRLGYIKQYDESMTWARATVKTTFENLKPDLTGFLSCVDFDQSENSSATACPLPSYLTNRDWAAFREWYSQLATAYFMQSDAESKRQIILNKLKQLYQKLPNDYRPKDHCRSWPNYADSPYTCVNQKNHLLQQVAIPIFKTWMYQGMYPLPSYWTIYRSLVVDDKGFPTAPRFLCSLSKKEFQKILLDFVDKQLINNKMRRMIENSAAVLPETGVQYFVREFFYVNPKRPSTLSYARFLVVTNDLPNYYHMGYTFYDVKLSFTLTPSSDPPKDCDHSSPYYCTINQVKTFKQDEKVEMCLRANAMLPVQYMF